MGIGAAAAAAFAVLLEPTWLDYERARRSLLLVLVGALLVARPRWFLARPAGDAILWILLGWLGLSAVVNVGDLVPAEAAMRFTWVLTLLLLTRLGATTGPAPWTAAACGLLVVAAAAGLLQRLGLPWFSGTAAEPTSLFGNRNVAAEFCAIAGAAAAAGFHRHPRATFAALVLGAAYGWVNGSRSILVALPLGVAFAMAVDRAARARWRATPGAGLLRNPAVALLCGGLLGVATNAVAAGGDPDLTLRPLPSVRTHTLEVRMEIAANGLLMVGDAPLLGHGPGQFEVQYPRYRSQREIELSSFGRAERRRVITAHDDWLELAIEGGLPALLLLLGYAAMRLHGARGDRGRLAPLVALGALMLVRAPLGNAPAVALALLASALPRTRDHEPAPGRPLPATGPEPERPRLAAAGEPPAAPGQPADEPSPSADGPEPTDSATAPPPRRRTVVAFRLLGMLPLLLGGCTLLAAVFQADYLRQRGEEPLGPVAPLLRSTSAWPFDPVPWHLLAQERQARAGSLQEAEAALDAAEAAVALRPDEPAFLLLRADLLRMCGRLPEAREDLAHVSRLDPGDPEVNVRLAGTYFTEGNVEGAVAALYVDPPPVLRATLAERLDEFADVARAAGDDAAARRFLAEASFVRALDATGAEGPRAAAIAKERFDTMRLAFAEADLHQTDLREFVVLALLALDLGDRATAAAAAEAAAAPGRALPAWQWPLLRAPAARLRELPEWRALLPE